MTATLPAFDIVRDDVDASIQEVVAVLPTTGPVQDLGDSVLGCRGTGVPAPDASVSFSNHIVVAQSAHFDAEAFLSGLPQLLGNSYTVRKSGLDLRFPQVQFTKTDGYVSLISVSTGELDGERFVEISGYSVCAQPETPSIP